MGEERPIVEALGYIGGQDEDLGGYCEPLIIRTNGNEHYVLHSMWTYRDTADGDKVKAKHEKVEFGSLEKLTKAFAKVEATLGVDKSLPWEETDSSCGYEVSEGEFEEARPRRYERDYGN